MPAGQPWPAQRRLRIAVFNRTFSPTGGGAERYSIALVEQLAALHEVHVFGQVIDHHWPGVSYHRVSAPLRKSRWLNQLWYATATWRATRRGFDVVHSHENTWHGNVQTVHVLPVKYNLFHGCTGWRRVFRWLKVASSPRLLTYLGLEHFRYVPRPGRQVVVTSDSLKAIMAASYPASAAAVSVITPGVTMAAQSVSADQKQKARAALGLPIDARCLLFVGNDYRKKGLATLLAALAQLPADVVLAVVGHAAQIVAFREPAQALKLGQRVFFLGSLKDVGPAYEAADCLVHPTLEDTFAMVVLEAMAHGLPVLVSGPQYCGISGLLQHTVNAMILDDPRDATQLADAVAKVFEQGGLREQLTHGAREFAAHFQWPEIAARQLAVYFRALGASNSGMADR